MSYAATIDLVTHLRADSSVIAQVDTYKLLPAIFSIVPEDAPDTYVWIPPAHTVRDSSAKNGDDFSIEEYRDVRCVSPHARKVTGVEQLAEAVRKSLQRGSISAQGSASIEIAEAIGPVEADGRDYFGRIVELRLIVREAS